MSGPTFVRALRERGDTIPIIGISGNPGNADEFIAAGANAFLTGSAFSAEFIPPIQRLLEGHPVVAQRGVGERLDA